MKIAIFVLLAFLGVGIGSCHREVITISDANPIQFWLTGTETFNQKEVCSIEPACYCHIVHCDDLVRIQFKDSFPGRFRYDLLILDSLDVTIVSYEFQQMDDGYYQVEFQFDDTTPDSCGIKTQLQIQRKEIFYNGSFESGSLSPWVQVADGGVGSWVWQNFGGTASARMAINLASASGSSRTTIALRHVFYQIVPGSVHQFTFSVTAGIRTASVGSWQDSDLVAVYYLNGVEVGSEVLQTMANNTSYINNWTPAFIFDTIGFRVVFKYTVSGGIFSGAWQINVKSFTLASDVVYDVDIIAQSDCLDVKNPDTQDCTILFQYSNTRNFAGLDYEDSGSPENIFYVRFPGTFFHESFPTTGEEIDLSNSQIVPLWDEVKAKRRMDFNFMPYYMYRKANLVFSHDSIYNDSKYWIKAGGDQIVINEGNKRYPLKSATLLLTEKDFIERNVL